MITALTGLTEEANVLAYSNDAPNDLLVLTGLKALTNLDTLVPADCEAIASWGTAGAVTPEVKVGSVIALVTVYTDGGKVYTADKEWMARIAKAFPEVITITGYSSPNEVATTAVLKAALATKYPVKTVDMGAYAVAEFAIKRGIPWVAIEGISDAFDQDVTTAAAGAMNDDGSANISEIIRELGENPTEMRGLVRVTDSFTQAISGLQRCFFAIGSGLGWS